AETGNVPGPTPRNTARPTIDRTAQSAEATLMRRSPAKRYTITTPSTAASTKATVVSVTSRLRRPKKIKACGTAIVSAASKAYRQNSENDSRNGTRNQRAGSNTIAAATSVRQPLRAIGGSPRAARFAKKLTAVPQATAQRKATITARVLYSMM